MDFPALQTMCWTGVLTGPGANTVDYKSRPDVGAEAAWVVGISAHVYQGNREEPSDFDMIARMGQEPIYVTMRKASITSLRVGRDWIRYNSVVYTVKAIVSDDGVAMELFCAR